MRSYVALLALVVAFAGCKREQRNVRPSPTRLAIYGNAARESDLQPGGAQSQQRVGNPYEGNAFAISEGQRLYTWYNCSGCHFNGGGGIGPPLIKTEWVYGGESANIFDTIVKGRPNGMPAWGGRIPEYQIWEIVAFVRSLNGKEPSAATAARPDSVENATDSITNKTNGVTK